MIILYTCIHIRARPDYPTANSYDQRQRYNACTHVSIFILYNFMIYDPGSRSYRRIKHGGADGRFTFLRFPPPHFFAVQSFVFSTDRAGSYDGCPKKSVV